MTDSLVAIINYFYDKGCVVMGIDEGKVSMNFLFQ